ncbi:alginate O-acetyltransferase AlgF [Rhodoferax sp.]|uniref:alginate O-acetyltransferase AlgF n=1 Tax=Rhodoferax sp. TaxID=50421 RepID=UPI002620A23C|nr:alginate O-acetyltransferase AlgF [Rhodoferax sp.]MDD2809229.1 alginate O-acetyltransferase AlgF [Rhodoferax sp.]MDD4943877.1 alginate O-acetyltransferase AlgF [Rhodoferax sp.]MDD5480145.1 alginate O-acetyltransferase AlgF [Rhodoferax sp.]
MKHTLIPLAGALLGALVAAHASAETQLYETGPSADSSFVRFLNGNAEPVTITNGAAQLVLGRGAEARVSKFLPVKGGASLSAHAQLGSQKLPLQVVAQPSEFVTMAVFGKDASARTVLLREKPDDFNAMRASVALLNLDEKCTSASLLASPKNTLILDAVAPTQVKRRLVNPVKLSVQVNCNGKPVGAVLDMAQLQAGERYSVFVLPGKAAAQTFFVMDSTP